MGLVTCVTPVTPRFEDWRNRSRTRATASLTAFLRYDCGLDDVDALRSPLNLSNAQESIRGAFEHVPSLKSARYHCGVKPCADLRFPSLRRYQPFAVVTVTPTPTISIGNGAARIAEVNEAGIAILFNKQTDLRYSGMNFTGFCAATTVQPINETLTCGFDRLTLGPRDDAELSR